MLSDMTRRTLSTPSVTRLIRIAVLASVGPLALAGCVSGGATPSSPPSHSQSASRSSSGSADTVQQTQWISVGSATRLDLLSLDRISANIVALRIRIANNGSDSVQVSDAFRPAVGQMYSFGGMELVDGNHLKAYYPWSKSSDGSIVESGFPQLGNVEPNTYFTASILFPAPPPSVTAVDIYAPRVTFSDVPINPHGTTQDIDPNFTKSDMNAPNVLPIRATEEDLSGDQAVDDSGDHVAVRLSSDVLFKLNKADLTDKASALLNQVASRIDQAKGTTVSVDGYTDSSGNDAINNPLSKRRAETVHSALQKLVTRQGITFKVAGHGSSDPVASNKSSDGRKKNRRVTISFSK